MTPSDDGLFSALRERGVSRRTFLRFCAAMAGALAIPATYGPRIATALTSAPRMPVVWLRGQGCGGDGEALLRASNPTVGELILQVVSLEFADSLMTPSGTTAVSALGNIASTFPNGYLAVVEGAVPLADDGVYGLTGGRVFRDVAHELCGGALATIAVGSCAFDGGLPGAAGGATGAAGVASIVGADRLVNLPGCPVNADNLVATIVHFVTFRELPARDLRGRPLFAYGGLVHNQCERRSHFEYGEFVLEWGDEAAQKGWCLYKMGCKGPETFANCPTVRYGGGASWPVKAGHGCIGCTMPAFWDAMSPFYRRLPSPLPFAPDITVDQLGAAAVAGVAALTAAHGATSYARQRVLGARERLRARRQAAIESEAEAWLEPEIQGLPTPDIVESAPPPGRTRAEVAPPELSEPLEVEPAAPSELGEPAGTGPTAETASPMAPIAGEIDELPGEPSLVAHDADGVDDTDAAADPEPGA
jgi:hydrogenase small subunit